MYVNEITYINGLVVKPVVLITVEKVCSSIGRRLESIINAARQASPVRQGCRVSGGDSLSSLITIVIGAYNDTHRK